jgi:hypothetical protein
LKHASLSARNRIRELMASAPDSDLADRLARLERELKELHQRVASLERLMGAGELHPTDSSTVQKKVTFDWQT